MWITLTSSKVAERFAAAEFTAVKSASLQSGQTAAEMITEVIERVTNEVRGYVAACSRNLLGEAGTIPDELEDAALALFVYRFLTRLPNLKSLLDDRRVKAYEDAVALLKNVAVCKFAIVPPTTAAADAEQAGGGNMEVINSRVRRARREDVAGLL